MSIELEDNDAHTFYMVLDLVRQWQEKGRTGFCLPVLSGALLKNLEELSDRERRNNCTWCHASGISDNGNTCPHCEPLLK